MADVGQIEDEFLWILEFAIDQYFIMHMWPSGPAGVADGGNLFAARNLLAGLDHVLMIVTIPGHHAITMRNHYEVSKSSFGAREDDDAVGGSQDGGSHRRRDIDSGVIGALPGKW